MTNQHPIVPPPDKIHNWLQLEKIGYTIEQIITVAAQYGADEELEACCEWLKVKHWVEPEFADELRAARRPKPPSLAEQALELVDRIEKAESVWNMRELDTIRAALERLQELENGNE